MQGSKIASPVMRGQKVQVSSKRDTQERVNTDVFSGGPGGNREPDEYSWGGDELCCLQHAATLKALTLLLLSLEVLAAEPGGPQHGAPASNHQLSSEIINLLC